MSRENRVECFNYFSQGEDLYELRRHSYSSSVDHFTVKQLVQKSFLNCQCDRESSKLLHTVGSVLTILLQDPVLVMRLLFPLNLLFSPWTQGRRHWLRYCATYS